MSPELTWKNRLKSGQGGTIVAELKCGKVTIGRVKRWWPIGKPCRYQVEVAFMPQVDRLYMTIDDARKAVEKVCGVVL